MAVPELPEELFIESLRQLIAIDRAWVAPAGSEKSLYLRPLIVAAEPGLGMRPANAYRYLMIASPAGAYFARGIAPVSVWLSMEFLRACPGGTGAARFAGNYAGSHRHRHKPPKTVAIRWCGSTLRSGDSSRRWAG
jgi:branched-chain amino acid aminotransferase